MLTGESERAKRRMGPFQEHEEGPFDIIGDIHGCIATLEALMARMGYCEDGVGGWAHPEGRRPLFLGDYINRGPASEDVVGAVRTSVTGPGRGLALAGNHEDMLLACAGQGHLFEGWVAQLDMTLLEWLGTLPSFLVVDGGTLVVSHAPMAYETVRGNRAVDAHREGLWGARRGEWEKSWKGRAEGYVFGHIAAGTKPVAIGRGVCVDTRCGMPRGRLSGLQYPEWRWVSVEMDVEEERYVCTKDGYAGRLAELEGAGDDGRRRAKAREEVEGQGELSGTW